MNTKTDLFRTNITQLKGKYELTREMVHFNGSSQEKNKICEIKELGLLIGVGDISTKIIDSRYIDIFKNIDQLSTKIKYR